MQERSSGTACGVDIVSSSALLNTRQGSASASPTWPHVLLCAEVDAVDADALLEQLEGYGTCMWLDLKPDCDRQRLADQLRNISPFMLLNLRRLR